MCRPKIIVTFSPQSHCRGRFKIGGRPDAQFAARFAAQVAAAVDAGGGDDVHAAQVIGQDCR